jgi:hypothetical protein
MSTSKRDDIMEKLKQKMKERKQREKEAQESSPQSQSTPEGSITIQLPAGPLGLKFDKRDAGGEVC